VQKTTGDRGWRLGPDERFDLDAPGGGAASRREYQASIGARPDSARVLVIPCYTRTLCLISRFMTLPSALRGKESNTTSLRGTL
jgi:hypothetical protein